MHSLDTCNVFPCSLNTTWTINIAYEYNSHSFLKLFAGWTVHEEDFIIKKKYYTLLCLTVSYHLREEMKPIAWTPDTGSFHIWTSYVMGNLFYSQVCFNSIFPQCEQKEYQITRGIDLLVCFETNHTPHHLWSTGVSMFHFERNITSIIFQLNFDLAYNIPAKDMHWQSYQA